MNKMDMNEDFSLLIDLHKREKRQGPGSDLETDKAINLSSIDRNKPLKIADIGCGTGASTLALAKALNCDIIAVDFLPEFIDILKQRARDEGLENRIQAMVGSMDDLPFDKETFDVIWSEGAIYNMGFKKGVTYWRQFLKPGGTLAVSELSWLTEERPAEIQKYWRKEYPEIDTASAKIGVLETAGYTPTGYFALPENCWMDHYYQPIRDSLGDFLNRNQHSQQAQVVVQQETREIELYEKYSSFYGYGFYIARKTVN